MKPENRDGLATILTYHVVAGNVPASVAVNLRKATALNKQDIQVSLRNGALFLNDSKVVKTDIACRNGVIHVIDSVLLPPEGVAQTATGPAASRKLIRLAIERGAPLFNHGQHQACAAIYEVTAHALVSMPESSVSAGEKKMLPGAISEAAGTHSKTKQAWTFRHAFDEMMGAGS